MLSYRHAFHAGNHADILKHSLLTLVLQSLHKKEKPFSLIDTHAGAGLYILDDERALKTGETSLGIISLLEKIQNQSDIKVPEEILPYINLCKKYQKENKYPGSPEIMVNYLRDKDKIQLIELHNTEIDILRVNMKKKVHDGRLGIHHRNAFDAINALLPPEPKRGLLLMDPSYEVDSDYENVVEAFKLAHKKWSSGILCLWYPLLKHRETELSMMKSSLRELAANTPTSFLCIELLVDSPEKEMGLYGSGMAVINMPWHLDDQMKNILPFLAKNLAVNPEIFPGDFNLIVDNV
ncbi:MAG: 23S rRNA (adenine(2030)-N(6))-methyltransferase RlmJ [Spirochaetaceae bacterium]|nr:23S rRNA (adenine(2030)-N(6))-methyltransferase RlmJ [Spirochaetaceae bacterium]